MRMFMGVEWLMSAVTVPDLEEQWIAVLDTATATDAGTVLAMMRMAAWKMAMGVVKETQTVVVEEMVLAA